MPPKDKHCHFHFSCFITWVILIIVFMIGLYFVIPKYEIMSPKYRFNKVTGKVETYMQAVGEDLEDMTPPR